MRKNVLKQTLLALCLMLALPFAKAQVRVGDILCEGDVFVSPNSLEASVSNAIGVVAYVDASGKHGWAIALDDIGEYALGPNAKDTPLRNHMNKASATNDLDGYKNTQTILKRGYDIPFPAFDSLDFENGWYLPAIGQLKRLYDNLDKVNEGLEAAGGTTFSKEIEWEYWSSTEYSICNAWNIDFNGELHSKDHSFNGNKDDWRFIRPFKNF